MIRPTLFGISMLALTAGSAFAAPAKHQVAKSHVVAQEGSATPATDKPAKKATKSSTKKSKSTKTDAAKGDSGKEMKAPAPETK
jgi:BRCT domain type II-containing protein